MSDVLIKAYHGGLGDCLQFSTLPENSQNNKVEILMFWMNLILETKKYMI